ncbi:MAG: hypothetical protein FJ271_20650 [Planctomycetes bacterium]|nr:hypothetical protein [Planctomycetota bacterium]
MKLYLDDDSVHHLLVQLLLREGHEVRLPADLGLTGEEDPVHLRFAIREDRALLTRNFDDFRNLHELVMESRGHHSGILVVRRDNDPHRDMKAPNIVRAIRNLLAAAVPVLDQFIILNHWR